MAVVDVTGTELAKNPDVAGDRLATGSTVVGNNSREAVDTCHETGDPRAKRGKAPNIILDDADFAKAIPMAVNACFMNNGQACIAGSRLLVPENRLEEVKEMVITTISVD